MRSAKAKRLRLAVASCFGGNIPALVESATALLRDVARAGGQRSWLSSRTFHELWPHMLIHFSDEYPDILRLVVIALLIPTDTSECERIFSLMNDLKTAQRSALAEKLSSLMVWHVAGRTMPCCDVPVLDILHEFRALAGIRGRNAHRGHQLPVYDHKVKAEIEDPD